VPSISAVLLHVHMYYTTSLEFCFSFLSSLLFLFTSGLFGIHLRLLDFCCCMIHPSFVLTSLLRLPLYQIFSFPTDFYHYIRSKCEALDACRGATISFLYYYVYLSYLVRRFINATYKNDLPAKVFFSFSTSLSRLSFVAASSSFGHF